MKKNSILASLLLLCTLSSCSLHIKDTNGDDNYSLTTITDQTILDNAYPVVKYMAFHNKVNGSNVYKAKKFSGVEKIDTFKGGFTLYITSEVYSGNFRICLVSNDRIVKDFDVKGSDSFAAIDSNSYDLYIAGESCKFEFSYFTE